MGSANLSSKNAAENPQQRSTRFLAVLRKHLAIFTEHYRQPVSELSVIAYAEDLQKLTPEELDAACVLARQSSEFMPVSAAILRAHKELLNSNAGEFLGPRLDWNPELEKERLERKLLFEKALANGEVETEKPTPIQPKKRQLGAIHPAKSLEEQKRELREKGWLQ